MNDETLKKRADANRRRQKKLSDRLQKERLKHKRDIARVYFERFLIYVLGEDGYSEILDDKDGSFCCFVRSDDDDAFWRLVIVGMLFQIKTVTIKPVITDDGEAKLLVKVSASDLPLYQSKFKAKQFVKAVKETQKEFDQIVGDELRSLHKTVREMENMMDNRGRNLRMAEATHQIEQAIADASTDQAIDIE